MLEVVSILYKENTLCIINTPYDLHQIGELCIQDIIRLIICIHEKQPIDPALQATLTALADFKVALLKLFITQNISLHLTPLKQTINDNPSTRLDNVSDLIEEETDLTLQNLSL